MSKLRPECGNSNRPALPNDTALFMIRDSVAKRRTLIFGQLNDGEWRHCALGWFWKDNPELILNTVLVDEVAAINDSIPPTASSKERWRKVMSWLRWKIRVLATKEKP